MKICNEFLAVFAIALTLSFMGSSFAAQVGPRVELSPEIVPYKPGRLKLPPIQQCQDFQTNPEMDVLYKRAEGVTQPKVTRRVWTALTEQGKDVYRRNLFKDPNDVISRISVIVDKQGRPQDPCLVKAAVFDLDQQATEVAMQYRFNPALKDGKPIPMRIQIEVRYQTH